MIFNITLILSIGAMCFVATTNLVSAIGLAAIIMCPLIWMLVERGFGE